MNDASILKEIRRLRGMSVGELRLRWRELYGADTRSRNREFLFRRLAWRVQELALGGLSERARARIEELAPDRFERVRPPAHAIPDMGESELRAESRPRRDPRLPVPGSIISKAYKGRELRVTVREGGYEFDGGMFPSLTAIAKAVTWSKNINGRLFFGLTGRRR